ncbi:MAG TPA: hypothetical protein VGR76_02145 [Candidatus Angelobacter sp.]|nr:hypothetical protein [Candidatus Angelobacter sp.]
MKKILLAALLLCASLGAHAQGSTILFPPAINQNGSPLPFAAITVCSVPTTVNTLGVCQTPVTVFQDQGLTTPYSSAIRTDGIGDFPPNFVTLTSLWFSPGNYCFTLTTANMISPATNPCTPFSVPVAAGSAPNFVAIKFTETTAPTCLAGFDFLWGDSAAHRLKECDNGGAAVQIVHAGVDVNTSDQVTATHLASPLPTTQGGTGQNSTATYPTSGTVNTGTGTNNVVPKFTTGASGIIGNSAITDNGTLISSTEPYAEVEAAAPSGVASSDLLYADSTAHRWKMINNNGAAKTVAATDGDTFTNSVLASPQITGALAAGSGYATGSVATCNTGAGVGAACNNSITWSATLSSSTYRMLCELDSPNTAGGIGNTGSKTTTGAVVSTVDFTAGTAVSTGTVRCIALP